MSRTHRCTAQQSGQAQHRHAAKKSLEPRVHPHQAGHGLLDHPGAAPVGRQHQEQHEPSDLQVPGSHRRLADVTQRQNPGTECRGPAHPYPRAAHRSAHQQASRSHAAHHSEDRPEEHHIWSCRHIGTATLYNSTAHHSHIKAVHLIDSMHVSVRVSGAIV